MTWRNGDQGLSIHVAALGKNVLKQGEYTCLSRLDIIL